MTAEAPLREKYHAVGREVAGELLLRRRDALRFVEDCERLGLTILGLDFFHEDGESIVPLLTSADYGELLGDPDAARRSAAEARSLIERGLPDGATLVSVVVAE